MTWGRAIFVLQLDCCIVTNVLASESHKAVCRLALIADCGQVDIASDFMYNSIILMITFQPEGTA